MPTTTTTRLFSSASIVKFLSFLGHSFFVRHSLFLLLLLFVPFSSFHFPPAGSNCPRSFAGPKSFSVSIAYIRSFYFILFYRAIALFFPFHSFILLIDSIPLKELISLLITVLWKYQRDWYIFFSITIFLINIVNHLALLFSPTFLLPTINFNTPFSPLI